MLTKICNVCGDEFPATLEYFQRDRVGKYGLYFRCKECCSLLSKKLMIIVKHNPKNGFKICSKCERELLATAEYFYRHKDGKYGLTSICKECMREYNINWRISRGEYIPKPIPKSEYKFCTQCGLELPKTLKYFYHHSKEKMDGNHDKKLKRNIINH